MKTYIYVSAPLDSSHLAELFFRTAFVAQRSEPDVLFA